MAADVAQAVPQLAPRGTTVRRAAHRGDPHGEQGGEGDGEEHPRHGERALRSPGHQHGPRQERPHGVAQPDRQPAHPLDPGQLTGCRDARGQRSHRRHEDRVHHTEDQRDHGQQPQPRWRPREGSGGEEDHRAADPVAEDGDPARPEPVGHHTAAEHEDRTGDGPRRDHQPHLRGPSRTGGGPGQREEEDDVAGDGRGVRGQPAQDVGVPVGGPRGRGRVLGAHVSPAGGRAVSGTGNAWT